MNIVIAKLGRSIDFDAANDSMFSGDEAPRILYTTLAKRYPQHTFHLVGGSDIKRLRERQKGMLFGKIDIPKNIINWYNHPDYPIRNLNKILEDPKLKKLHPQAECFTEEARNTLTDATLRTVEAFSSSGIEPDLGIIMDGPVGGFNAWGVGLIGRRRETKQLDFAKMLVLCANYAGPPIHFLNMTNVPWFMINEDPRYLPCQAYDILNEPRVCLSQHTETHKWHRMKNYGSYHGDDPQPVNMAYEYAKVETIFLMNEKKVDFRPMPKTNKFLMGLNGGGDRFDMVKRWLLDHDRSIKIYGKWPEEQASQYPTNFAEVAIRDCEAEFWNTRYTLVLPMMKKNFVTQKFWKMLHYGILPFWHKDGYDVDRLLPWPEYFRVSGPGEMWEKIEDLEANPSKREEWLEYAYTQVLTSDLYDGSYIIELMNATAERTCGHRLDE